MTPRKWALGAVAFAITWPVLAAADEGRPVTAADLSGKKVCWYGGLVVTYQANGITLEKHRDGHLRRSTWSVPEPGLVQFGPVPGSPEWFNFARYNYAPMIVLPDGRFQTHRWLGVSGGSLTSADIYTDHWGTVCN